ncbi:hypothetical protein [Gemmata sp.]|uniref:hypothetical protein n=1 Tax=Gemmata sp. TaxID=1914242 RepID=UPI003F7150DE
MITALTLSLALAAPVPAPTAPVPTGAAPRVVEMKADASGKVMVTITRMEKVQIAVGAAIAPIGGGNAPPPAQLVREMPVTKAVELGEVKDLVFTQADGMKVEAEVAMKKLAGGAVVVMTSDGKAVSPAFLKVFKDDTLVLVSPEFVVPVGGIGGGVGKPGIIGRPGGIRPLPAVIPPGGGIQIQPGVIQILPAPVDEVAPVPPVAQPAPVVPMVDKTPKPAPVK